MNIAVFKERIKNLLLQLPDARLASAGKEIIMRCRYCGDSKKNLSSKHMYVQLPTGVGPMYYNCYRVNCTAKGVVTWDKLSEWGVNLSDDDIKDIIHYNKEILKSSSNIQFRDKEIYLLNNRSYNNQFNEIYNNKIKYINDRLGTDFTHIDLKRLKISLNILELLNENNLPILTQEWKLNAIGEKYICFITQDNAYAVCRNTQYEENKKGIMNYRYFKYKIFDIIDDNRNSFYIIPSKVNIYYPIKIYLTEGTFDILSIKYNVVNDDSNCIYCAVLGAGFIRAIKYFISNMKFINIEFHIYIDNDMGLNKINEIIELITPYQFNTFIHNNIYKNEKDFGVPKNKIIDNVKQVIKGW